MARVRRVILYQVAFTAWLLALGLPAWGANHYVRAGATGDGSGADWTNAYPQLPQDLVRGDTYYVATGKYPAYLFNDPEQGTEMITVKKAVATAHGTDTGWLTAYGDGVTTWGLIEISKSYLVFDGVTGKGTSGHGFEIYTGTGGVNLVTFYDAPKYITLSHVNMHLSSRELEPACDGICGDTPVSHITISNCYIHDISRAPLLMRYWTDLVFENNYVARNRSTAEVHAEAVSTHGGGNFIFRNNVFEDIEGTAMIANLASPTKNWQIYNNIFFYSGKVIMNGLGHGLVSDNFDNSDVNGLKFYNNTVYNIKGGGSGLQFWSKGSVNIVSTNNLWYNCDEISFNQLAHDYDTFSSCTLTFTYNREPGPHDQITNGDPFVDAAHQDFHLKDPSQPGLALPAPYNKDLDQKTRGADGNWDRGAYEYVSPAASPKSAGSKP